MIANNLEKDDKWIDKINSKYQLNDNDLVVRMNRCDLGKLFNYRADLIFFRTMENNDKTVGFWGGIKKK